MPLPFFKWPLLHFLISSFRPSILVLDLPFDGSVLLKLSKLVECPLTSSWRSSAAKTFSFILPSLMSSTRWNLRFTCNFGRSAKQNMKQKSCYLTTSNEVRSRYEPARKTHALTPCPQALPRARTEGTLWFLKLPENILLTW